MIKIIIWLEECHIQVIYPRLDLPFNQHNMTALYLLIIASIVVAATFLGAFIWSVKNNQFEDQQGSAMRMLHDNETSSDK